MFISSKLPYSFDKGGVDVWKRFLDSYNGSCDVSALKNIISNYNNQLGITEIQVFQSCVCAE